MKKIVFIVCLFNSLLIYSQIESESIDVLKGISKSEESDIKGTNKLSLLYKTFDVRVSYKNDAIILNAFELFPQLKRITKIKKVIIYNTEEKEIVTQNFDSVEAIISAKKLLKGVYTIYIQTDNGHINKEFIKK